MARETPRTNWTPADGVTDEDLNRIGRNQVNTYDEIDGLSAELSAEAIARQAAIAAESNDRQAADNVLQSTKMNNAIIGNNGGIGTIVNRTSTVVGDGQGGFTHTWSMPHSGVWYPKTPNLAIFNGNSISSFAGSTPITYQFWRIG